MKIIEYLLSTGIVEASRVHIVESVSEEVVLLSISLSVDEVSIEELDVDVTSELELSVDVSSVEDCVTISSVEDSVVGSSVVDFPVVPSVVEVSFDEVSVDSVSVVSMVDDIDSVDVSIVEVIGVDGGVVGFGSTWNCLNQSRYVAGSPR